MIKVRFHVSLRGVVALALSSPAPAADIFEIAMAGPFTILLAAVKAAGLVNMLRGRGPLTVFAPTDQAFAKLPQGTLESLLQPENQAMLQEILACHLFYGRILARDVKALHFARTVEGGTLAVAAMNGRVMLNNARVTKADIPASNGIFHVIDKVILPELGMTCIC